MKANVTRKTAVQSAHDKGVAEGCQYALLIAQIALNEKFCFGKNRLESFEKAVIELASMIPNSDEMLAHDAVKRFVKIRGINTKGREK